MYSNFLVTAQFSLITVIAIAGWKDIPQNPLLLGISALGLIIFFHALVMMGQLTFRIKPEPSDTATLCQRGIYRWIRHPMYLAELLVAGAFSIASTSPLISWVALLLLALVLRKKLLLEERYWLALYPKEYLVYMKSNHRIVPFLY